MNECVVCGRGQASLLYGDILKCRECGHIFRNLHLNDERLFRLYNKDYFFGGEHGEYSNYLAEKEALQNNFRLRLKILKDFFGPSRHKNLFEIGCAYGFFLDVAKNNFDNVQGIDINNDGVAYASGQLKLNVINADFLKHNFGSQQFDVVCMWDTIEHLRQPQLYLEKLSRHMRSGALIALTTGDIDSFNARLRKDKWRLMRPLTHVHFFSKKTLKKILNTYGFDIIYEHHCGSYRSVDTIVYRVLAAKRRCSRLYNFLHRSGLVNINIYINLYDIIYVVARKR